MAMLNLPKGTVTLLFTNIEGATRLLQQLGDGYATVLAQYRHLLRAAFKTYDGHEVDTQGDTFFVAFARAIDAISAAADAQHALFTYPWPEGLAVRVRMGIHTGEPSLASEGYVGLDVHHAARIMSAAHGGQVLLSQATHELVEHKLPPGVSLRDLGEHRLKDIGYPSHLFQLVIAGLPADFPPLRTLNTRFNNLPALLTPLIGREQELLALRAQLQHPEVRLVTLLGPGGVGKTRLSLQIATQMETDFAHGVCFVPLATISDPALVIPTIAQALGLEDRGQEQTQPLQQLQAYLRDKHMLLLLDNFEQVVGAAGEVAALLAISPMLKVLVTSREALHVRAELEFAVPPLAVPDPRRLPDLVTLSQYEAVALFIERAQAARPDFQLTNTNAPAVAEICARLDGLPLAIELAAARSKLLPPQALLARLGQRLQLLISSVRDVPARQQTLRNTIQWSYDLLDAQEQQLFCRLSVFVGGCTLEAVEAVSAALGDATLPVLDGVASLLDKSLLQKTVQEGEEIRLLMLETIREYAWEALAERQEREATQAAHAAYYLALAEEAELALGGSQQLLWLERLEREYDNLCAALHWLRQQGSSAGVGDEAAELALRLETALSWFWIVRGYQNDGRRRPRQLFLDLEEALSVQEVAPMPPATEIRQPSAPPATQTPPAPGGLTGREVEVLRLIAQGWTDAQIAEHLVISPRTVNRHTTSLYSKLGISSRSAATRYAIEHHLL